MNNKIGIVILNYNGWNVTSDCLDSLKKASAPDTIVIDNSSVDNSVIQIRKMYPEVQIITLEKNYGFAGGYNRGISRILDKYDYLFILNNDTIIPKDFFEKISKKIESLPKEIGMVACKLVLPDSGKIDSLGLVLHSSGYAFNRKNEMQKLFCPSGGAAFYSTQMLKDISAITGDYFDEDFKFYNEDLDLGFRARLLGWKVETFYEAPIIHIHSATMNKQKKHFALYYQHRNQVWSFVKNFPSKLIVKHFLTFLFFQCAAIVLGFLRGQIIPITKAKWESLNKLKLFIRKRNKIQSSMKASNSEIESNFSDESFFSLWKTS